MKKFYLPLMLLAASLCACGDDSPSDNPGGGGEPGGGPSGGVTDVVEVISDLTVELSTDKACYLPGDVVSFTADGTLPADARVRYRRGTEVVEEGNLGGNTWTWTPPSTDFTGYLADVYRTRDDGTQVILGTIGVDVSSDWTRFPRYGFVATFDDSKLQPGVIDEEMQFLSRCHINGVQFQDWHNKHHWPLGGTREAPAETYTDIANRSVSAEVIRRTTEGIRVPIEAVRLREQTVTDDDGGETLVRETGVYCIVGMEARFKPVEVLYSDENFALVRSTLDTADTTTGLEEIRLRAGDEVIITARDLYDGKTMS